MKDVLTVAKFTAKDMLNRKSFRISTIIIILLIILGFNVPNIISGVTDGEGFSNTTLFVDRDRLLGDFSAGYEQASPTEDGSQVWGQFSDEEVKEKLTDGNASSAWIITKSDEGAGNINLQYLVKNRATAPAPANETILLLQELYAQSHLLQQGFSEKDLQTIFPTFSVSVEQIDDQDINGDVFVIMMLSCVLFFAVYFCAYQVSSSITTEKTSKIIETLVTSTSPSAIVLGKTIGIGLVGLAQIIVFVLTAYISAQLFINPDILSNALDLSSLTLSLGLITIVYFLLGYFAYALLYALTGSTVGKPEDIQYANTPIALLSLFSFYLAYFTLVDPTSGLNIFAAIFPFSSPFCMPLRIMMGIASGWEVIVSILVLILTCMIVARIAIKIYSNAILHYGTRMTLIDIIKTYKAK